MRGEAAAGGAPDGQVRLEEDEQRRPVDLRSEESSYLSLIDCTRLRALGRARAQTLGYIGVCEQVALRMAACGAPDKNKCCRGTSLIRNSPPP